MRILETAALTLEPLTARHADEMFAVLGDPAIYAYENEPPASCWCSRSGSRRRSNASF